MAEKSILFERRGGIGIITVNRPEKRNALSFDAIRELGKVVDSLKDDATLRVLILTGAGDKAFIAGGDLRELLEVKTREEVQEFSLSVRRILDQLERMAPPTIAALNGGAFGGGCEIAVACDLRIASDRAVMAFRQVNIGVTPGWGGGQRLLRLVGRSRALKLLLTGEQVTAREAFQLGLVDEVVPHERLLARTLEVAETIAAHAPLAVPAIKRAINLGADLPLAEAIEREVEIFTDVWLTEDHEEAVRAFFEGRPPAFRGK